MASFYVDTLVYAHVLYNGMLQVSLMKSNSAERTKELASVCIILLMSDTVILVMAWGHLLLTPIHLCSPSQSLYLE